MNPANVCSAGSLVRARSRNGFKFSVGADLQPGGGRRAEVTIVNLGTLPGMFRLFEAEVVNEFPSGRLLLAIKEFCDGSAVRRVFIGEVGKLSANGIDLGRFAAGESRTYRFTVALAHDAPEGEADAVASAVYEWRPAGDGGR